MATPRDSNPCPGCHEIYNLHGRLFLDLYTEHNKMEQNLCNLDRRNYANQIIHRISRMMVTLLQTKKKYCGIRIFMGNQCSWTLGVILTQESTCV